VIQFATVVGVGNGIQHFRLALFALWPFGKKIRRSRPIAWPAQSGVFPTGVDGGGPAMQQRPASFADGAGMSHNLNQPVPFVMHLNQQLQEQIPQLQQLQQQQPPQPVPSMQAARSASIRGLDAESLRSVSVGVPSPTVSPLSAAATDMLGPLVPPNNPTAIAAVKNEQHRPAERPASTIYARPQPAFHRS
jgi:hypothetical protein